ncbi:MAG: hypothetical protein ACK56F_03430, partial [bacterium]
MQATCFTTDLLIAQCHPQLHWCPSTILPQGLSDDPTNLQLMQATCFTTDLLIAQCHPQTHWCQLKNSPQGLSVDPTNSQFVQTTCFITALLITQCNTLSHWFSNMTSPQVPSYDPTNTQHVQNPQYKHVTKHSKHMIQLLPQSTITTSIVTPIHMTSQHPYTHNHIQEPRQLLCSDKARGTTGELPDITATPRTTISNTQEPQQPLSPDKAGCTTGELLDIKATSGITSKWVPCSPFFSAACM